MCTTHAQYFMVKTTSLFKNGTRFISFNNWIVVTHINVLVDIDDKSMPLYLKKYSLPRRPCYPQHNQHSTGEQ